MSRTIGISMPKFSRTVKDELAKYADDNNPGERRLISALNRHDRRALDKTTRKDKVGKGCQSVEVK